MTLIAVGFVVLIFLIALGNVLVKKEQAKATRQMLSRQFVLDESFVSDADRSLIGLNFREKSIVLGSGTTGSKYRWDQVAAIEVSQNGSIVHQSNRGSQLASAVVGGVLLGGIGAVIGGLTGSLRSKERVKVLGLKVIVDDPVRPVYLVTFYKANGNGTPADSVLLREPKAKLERFHAHLVNAMRTAASNNLLAQEGNESLLQLERLALLRSQGVLSEEEFQG